MRRTPVIAFVALDTVAALPALGWERPIRGEVREFRQDRAEARRALREEHREDVMELFDR